MSELGFRICFKSGIAKSEIEHPKFEIKKNVRNNGSN